MDTGGRLGAAIEKYTPVISMRVAGPGACRMAKDSIKTVETIFTWQE